MLLGSDRDQSRSEVLRRLGDLGVGLPHVLAADVRLVLRQLVLLGLRIDLVHASTEALTIRELLRTWQGGSMTEK
jgi:hypothetical protein